MNITRKSFLILFPLLAVLASASTPDVADNAHLPLKFAAPGTEDNDEQICHSGRDCYPRVFKPTHEFQVIEADQEIPAGLHIRLDVVTGQRQAKINVPSEDDATNEVVVVPSEDEAPELPVGAPLEKPPHQQAIKPPKNASGDQGAFDASIASLLASESTQDTLSALADLSELSHEAYWGAHLTAAPGAVATLLELLSSAEPNVRASSALVLGSALSNNPKALSHAVESDLVAPVLAALKTEHDEPAKKRFLFLLGQTLRDGGVRGGFVERQGVEVLTAVFRAGSPAVKGKVAIVIEDAFLNADMRAGGAIKGRGEEGLSGFCVPFADAAVELAETEIDEATKVLSALSALKKRFGCDSGSRFGEWVGGFRGEGELEDGVASWRSRWGAGEKSEL